MYKFTPEDFGFEKVENFPELVEFLPEKAFVKVVAIGGSWFDRSVYWFSYCSPASNLSSDERWQISSSAYDDGSKSVSELGAVLDYRGLIGSEEFARLLLINIFGSSSRSNDGLENLKQNINDARFTRE